MFKKRKDAARADAMQYVAAVCNGIEDLADRLGKRLPKADLADLIDVLRAWALHARTTHDLSKVEERYRGWSYEDLIRFALEGVGENQSAVVRSAINSIGTAAYLDGTEQAVVDALSASLDAGATTVDLYRSVIALLAWVDFTYRTTGTEPLLKAVYK